MRSEEFDYHLPRERIAQHPAEPRDRARLMVVDRSKSEIEHHRFDALGALLRAGDLLVANDSRVLPARIRGSKLPGGGAVEALLLRASRDEPSIWRCLVRGRVRPGSRLRFESGTESVEAEVLELLDGGQRKLRFSRPVSDWLEGIGEMPLPPYIRHLPEDPERYQTVYARRPGSSAAPTAGLHFTPALREDLRRAGVGWASVTLHIGLDTFKPMEAGDIEAHRIHREWIELPEATARAIADARAAGGRIIAVGTTSMRVLESAAGWAESAGSKAAVVAGSAWTDLYLRPGSRFHVVDALLTNFHLPRSSLLVLVAAFAGKDLIDRAYREAIEGEYRFFSFGDAMFIR